MGLFDLFSSEKKKGSQGEKEIGRELGIHSLLGKHGKILRNVYVPIGKRTSEIDLLFLCQKGIFVIESKNVAGIVYGSEWQKDWTVLLFGGSKHLLYNPIKQNLTHLENLNKWLSGRNVPKEAFYNLVIFSDKAKLYNVTWMNSDTNVLNVNQLSAFLKEIWKEKPDVITREQVNELAEVLRPLTKVSRKTKEEHVQWVNQVKAAEDPERE